MEGMGKKYRRKKENIQKGIKADKNDDRPSERNEGKMKGGREVIKVHEG
jgi:hypothetical protein